MQIATLRLVEDPVRIQTAANRERSEQHFSMKPADLLIDSLRYRERQNPSLDAFSIDANGRWFIPLRVRIVPFDETVRLGHKG